MSAPSLDVLVAAHFSTLLDELMIDLSEAHGAPQVLVGAVEGAALAFAAHLRRLEFEGPGLDFVRGQLLERFEAALEGYCEALPDEAAH